MGYAFVTTDKKKRHQTGFKTWYAFGTPRNYDRYYKLRQLLQITTEQLLSIQQINSNSTRGNVKEGIYRLLGVNFCYDQRRNCYVPEVLSNEVESHEELARVENYLFSFCLVRPLCQQQIPALATHIAVVLYQLSFLLI